MICWLLDSFKKRGKIEPPPKAKARYLLQSRVFGFDRKNVFLPSLHGLWTTTNLFVDFDVLAIWIN